MISGKIFNIQQFSVHDGPGIRDVVFFKGCPLQCAWCSNPESQDPGLQLAYNKKKCILCGYCLKACSNGAIIINSQGVTIDKTKCVHCFKCVKTCYAQALHVWGEEKTVDEVFELTQNRPHSWRVNGGITLSGGEVLLQAEFAAELLKKYQQNGINTAIETSGYGSWENLKKIAGWCNLIFYDFKLFDSEKHKKYTGVDNTLIKENLLKLCEEFPNLDIIVRTPLIPGINDDKKNLNDTVEFLKNLPIKDYELLAFHNFGAQKYIQLAKEYEFAHLSNADAEYVKNINDKLRKKLNLL